MRFFIAISAFVAATLLQGTAAFPAPSPVGFTCDCIILTSQGYKPCCGGPGPVIIPSSLSSSTSTKTTTKTTTKTSATKKPTLTLTAFPSGFPTPRIPIPVHSTSTSYTFPRPHIPIPVQSPKN
ncbi:hypothetical protein CF327_g4270 [Tilletia walkeri]|uniref:Hydrophobin n=1 Tax=Tilletia walkeri TaxID=117179 RepID=A0A8X7T5P8_9BASI|nr:hypothetical protein CF327_g4270 [Tilletia walkeri]KAE8269937.1 hypothetical protein A4X09_0g2415 [Tilletia walkeri]